MLLWKYLTKAILFQQSCIAMSEYLAYTCNWWKDFNLSGRFLKYISFISIPVFMNIFGQYAISLSPPHPITILIIPAKAVVILIVTAEFWTERVTVLHTEMGKGVKMSIGFTTSGILKKNFLIKYLDYTYIKLVVCVQWIRRSFTIRILYVQKDDMSSISFVLRRRSDIPNS